MLRTVLMEDGTKITGVPDDVSDEQAKEDLREKRRQVGGTRAVAPLRAPPVSTEPQKLQQIEETIAEEKETDRSYLEEVGVDMKKVMSRIGLAVPNLAYDIAEGSGIDIDKEKKARVFNNTLKSVFGAVGLSSDDVLDEETGKIKPTETAPGVVGEIGAFIGTGGLLSKGVTEAAPFIIRAGIGALGAEQLLSDPVEGNLANVLQDVAPDSAGKLAVVEYLASEEDDNVLLQRAKMATASLGVGGLLTAGFKATVLTAKSAQLFGKKITELTKAEEEELVEQMLKDAKQAAKTDEVAVAQQGFKETDEGLAQIIAQSNPDESFSFASGLRRIQQRFLTSRGYFTPAAFAASREAIATQRQIISQGEHIANRLNIAVSRIEDEALGSSNDVLLRAQDALSSDLNYLKNVNPDERVSSVASQFNLPETVAEEILNARVLIDDLSATLLNSRVATKETKEAIANNMGQYLNRSYRLFEDARYTPDEAVKKEAIEFLVKEKRASNKSISLPAAQRWAEQRVAKILAEGNQANISNYFVNARNVNKNILKYKKDIPAPMRKLLGEIEDPAENIMLTVSKLAQLSENSKFYDRLLELGGKGKFKYIFKEGQDFDSSRFSAQITGTGTDLDGRFTTPEMLKAIQGTEETFGLVNTTLGKYFVSAKGMSQKTKTVYSHQAQARNFLGGAQFGLANGWLPVMGKEGTNSYASLKNQVFLKGDKEFDEYYEKLQGLGVINTSVRVGEFRALLSSGEDVLPNRVLDWASDLAEKAGVSKNAQRLPENVYMAIDDFYKINNFHRELNVLKKAFPEQSQEVLEMRAAEIIKNTMPNYDLVPKGIKAIRELPVGNFVSFPSEIIRTSAYIAKQASEEIALGLKGNDVMLKRGSARLAGMIGTNAMWSGLAAGSYKVAGLTYEEYKAMNILTERDYSKQHNKIVMRDGDKIFYNDPVFLDSYNTIREPVIVAAQRIQQGELQGEELDRYLAGAMFEGTMKLLGPYVDPAILSEAGAELLEAARSPTGRSSSGQLLFAPEASTLEKAGIGVAHLMNAFVPGSFKNLKDLGDAAFQVQDRKGRTRDFEKELVANMSGVRFGEFDPRRDMESSVNRYLSASRYSLAPISPDYVTTAKDLVSSYAEKQDFRLKAAKELYRKFLAAQYFLSDAEIGQIMSESGMSDEELKSIMYNKFSAEEIPGRLKYEIYEKTPFSEDNKAREYNETVDKLNRLYVDYSLKTLIEPSKAEEYFSEDREGMEKGGEVTDVPNVPTEPDQRIDKMTGMPYDQQAGMAFVDEEDPVRRLGFVGGGLTQDPLQRLGFVGGGLSRLLKLGIKAVDEIDAKPAAKEVVEENVDDTIRPYKSVPRPATYEEMNMALDARKKEKINVAIPEGQKVGLRLDIPAYTRHDVWVPTIHDEGGTKLTSHRATAAIKDVDLFMSEANQIKGEKIKKRQKPKSPFARIGGKLINRSDEENYALAQKYLNDPEWTQVGYNPDKHSYFFDRATGDPVIGGDEAIQVGPLVLVKNAVKGDRKDFRYVEGGKVLSGLKRRANGL